MVFNDGMFKKVYFFPRQKQDYSYQVKVCLEKVHPATNYLASTEPTSQKFQASCSPVIFASFFLNSLSNGSTVGIYMSGQRREGDYAPEFVFFTDHDKYLLSYHESNRTSSASDGGTGTG